ncbi:MAG: class II fructose-bisphosphate aldolase [Peptoniphilaceae bacterium]|nr:class II fructose-bisphosphate aldolase [Peptoniphilaceae bacterium]MDY6085246.1 class II fructose-bisphosphate aldolase [Peptoniphilaceae bacterium]
MLVTMQSLLAEAKKGRYAVGGFNCATLENIRAAVAAAEALDAPVILEYAEAHEQWIPLAEIGPIMLDYARRARVPVAVHLDHGTTYARFVEAIRLGFTSVMVDASALPFDENVARTQEIVKLAHSVGVTVEAELGHVFNSSIGAAKGAVADAEEEHEDLDAIYTDPALAKAFVEQTQVDCLAIAFGTVHGVYLSEPKLDLPRVARIRDAVGIPLVMHGGSGVKPEDYRTAIQNGICKINYYTYVNQDGGEAVRRHVENGGDRVFFDAVSAVATEAMQKHYEEAIALFRARD